MKNTTSTRKNLNRLNLLIGLAVFVVVALLCGFYAALLGSQPGEAAVALGGLTGGMVGAGGAIWAVFLTLSRQREEETAKVADAIRTEVITLVKYVIGAVEICQHIAEGSRKIPRQDVLYIIKNLLSDPIVYPAVADRVGLLPHPHATIEFYLRLSEAKTMAEMLRNKTELPSAINVTAPPEYVTPEFATSIADSLITALQLARPIVANEGNSSEKSQLAGWVQVTVVGQIDDCLKSAKASFPNAESFQMPSSPHT